MAATLSLEYAYAAIAVIKMVTIVSICVVRVATVHHIMHSAYMASCNNIILISRIYFLCLAGKPAVNKRHSY